MPDKKDPGPRTLFLGMQNEMSFRAFIGLLKNGINICGLALAADADPIGGFSPVQSGRIVPLDSQSGLPIVNRFTSESIVQAANSREIPIMSIIRSNVAGLQKAISTFQPDVACIACFPLRLPEKILASVELGFLNLHPSLLPSHRGPVPLFWIFRSANQEASGVTVHRVDEGLDTGDIILQQGVEFTSGISGSAADRICGEIGGTLLARSLTGLWSGTLEPYPQPPGGGYDPWPNESDFRLSTSWSALRAFNFMRGTAHWKRSYPIIVAEETIGLKEALSCKPDSWAAGESTISGDIVFIQFRSGILEARKK